MSQRKDQKTRREEIDVSLKRVYQEVLDEDIPDRFQQLLAQLKDQGPDKTSGGSE